MGIAVTLDAWVNLSGNTFYYKPNLLPNPSFSDPITSLRVMAICTYHEKNKSSHIIYLFIYLFIYNASIYA